MPIIGGGGGGGTGSGGLTTIVDTTLGASAASFDVTGISQSFITLYAVLYARADDAATNSGANLRFNADAGNNYYRERTLATATGAVGSLENQAANAAQMGLMPAATATANRFGIAQVWIPNYANAANQKICNALAGLLFDNVSGDEYILNYTNAWLSTAAINRLTIFSATGGNWVAGSRLTVYAF